MKYDRHVSQQKNKSDKVIIINWVEREFRKNFYYDYVAYYIFNVLLWGYFAGFYLKNLSVFNAHIVKQIIFFRTVSLLIIIWMDLLNQ